ncbi:hypothetical protein HN51_021379, partial [Arachis hypogaea]
MDFLDYKISYETIKKRHYYKFCTIQCAIDFIFGTSQSLFKRCSINVIGWALEKGFVGYITAQRRTNSNGFVFKNCNIFKNGSTFLGRSWRPYARPTLFNPLIGINGITLNMSKTL